MAHPPGRGLAAEGAESGWQGRMRIARGVLCQWKSLWREEVQWSQLRAPMTSTEGPKQSRKAAVAAGGGAHFAR